MITQAEIDLRKEQEKLMETEHTFQTKFKQQPLKWKKFNSNAIIPTKRKTDV